MNRYLTVVSGVLTVCVLVAGCRGPEWFKVDLTPDGPAMHRSVSRNFGPEDYEAMAELYGIEADVATLAKFEDNATVELSLTGTFEGKMPDDNHSSGVLLYCDSSFGSSSWYSERFGGNDDLATLLDNQENAFHETWDMLLRAFEQLAGNEPGFAEVRAFLDTTVRADAWNMLLTLNVVDTATDATAIVDVDEYEDEDMSVFIRLFHMLDARGYVDSSKLWEYETRISDVDEESPGPLFEIIGAAIGRKMEIDGDDPIPAAFAKLVTLSSDELVDAVDRVVEAEGGESRISALAESAFVFDLNSFDYGGEALQVRLFLPVKPHWTNGIWVGETEEVVAAAGDSDESLTHAVPMHLEWTYPLASPDAADADLPLVIHAAWTEPNAEFQVKHFGALVLDDDNLVEYCNWFQGLPDTRKDEWRMFVESLSPGKALEDKLKAFYFSDETPYAPGDKSSGEIRSRIASDTIHDIIRKIAPPPKAE